jgi:hypothetical protein
VSSGSAGSGELHLAVASPDSGSHLLALRDWLASEDELRGRVRVHRRPPNPGEMGAVLDVLAVAVGSGGAVGVLIRSLLSWLGGRRADVIVTVSAPDGRQITVEVRRTSDPQAVLREVAILLDPAGELRA